MTQPGMYWRDAATVVIAAGCDENNHKERRVAYDYKVLLLQRSGQMRFHSESYVFPGGVTAPADSGQSWGQLYHRLTGLSLADIAHQLGNAGTRPPILCDDVKSEEIPRCISMRLTAIRETFEECGILLLIPAGSPQKNKAPVKDLRQMLDIDEDIFQSWRKSVTDDPGLFPQMCDSLGAVPNVWGLVEWSNWLTPVLKKVDKPPKKPKRFDTMFFHCCLDSIPKVDVDTNEIIKAVWDTPDRLIYQRATGAISTGVPQRYETLRMCHFHSLRDLCTFSHERALHGVRRHLVVVVACADGVVILYPGDDMFPASPDYVGMHGVITSDKKTADMREGVTNMHRLEQVGGDSRIICTLEYDLGHKAPMEEDAVVAKVKASISRL